MCKIKISEGDIDTIVSYLQVGGRKFAYTEETGVFYMEDEEGLTVEPLFIIEVEPSVGGLLKKES